MASSNSQASQRRKPLKKRQQLSRSNSSLLGTIKNLVTAPLAWFASTDDFENSKDPQGKRRRLVAAPTEPNVDEDDRLSRNKRMRVHSPPRGHQDSHQPPLRDVYGYLDPPGSAFQQPDLSNQPFTTRSGSTPATLPNLQAYDAPRNANNLIRTAALSRTMSIDPPSRPLSRSSAMASIPAPLNRNTSVGPPTTFVRPIMRDLSMPPLSAHPSFRMRTSVTPQPQPQRELSEPPPLKALISNPMFVHGPPVQTVDSQQHGLSRQSSVTLGSLVESTRSTRSPMRQHSSLLFGSNVDNNISNRPRQQSPAEKALHELDIYKTPLLPTRLRSTNIPASSSNTINSSTDLFKSRRLSHLVLMQDDKRASRLGRKVSGKKNVPLVNETKPYAGEGGMKKLLARRKMEAEEDQNRFFKDGEGSAEEEVDEGEDEGAMDDDHKKSTRSPNNARTDLDSTITAPLPPPKADWFSVPSASSSSSTSTSSLRVGRTKTRAHFVRPTSRPMKTKFSAAFDDDDAMDDGESGQEEESRKEREMLDEAAKRAPIFEIPQGFSFAKETAAVKHDMADAKEPPIVSLPFSFSKVASPPGVTQTPSTQLEATGLGSFSTEASKPSTDSASDVPTSFSPGTHAIRAPSPNPHCARQVAQHTSSTPPTTTAPTPAPANGIPNFFANSSIISKPLVATPPPALAFPAPSKPAAPEITPSTTASIGITPSVPVKDTENPLWEGESQKRTDSEASRDTGGSGRAGSSTNTGLFGEVRSSAFSAPSSSGSNTKPSISIFEAGEKKDGGASAGQESQPSQPSVSMSAFLFSKPVASVPSTFFGKEVPERILPFSGSAMKVAPSSGGEVPKSTSVFGAGDTSKPTGLFGSDAPKPASHASFSFSQPAPPAAAIVEAPNTLFKGSTPSTEVSKPLFGGTTDFSFGNTTGTRAAADERKPANTPFSAGAAPSTPPPVTDSKKSTMFSFGTTPTLTAQPSAPAPITFSFSGGGSNASDISSKPFLFGTPTANRPTTPPKHQEQEFRMEESPTRDMQQVNGSDKAVEPRPTLGSSGFPFNSSASGPIFGGQASGPTPFSFATPSPAPNPFAKDNKPEENKPFGGFGQSVPSSSGSTFPFGQNKTSDKIDPPRPPATGSFSFGPAPPSATGPGPSFAFGGPSNSSTVSLFGQVTQPSSSAPSSPSTFNQPSPFSFAAPLPSPNNAFSFGSSQPSSPAGGSTNVILPTPATSGGFGSGGGGGFGQTTPSSPFGASAAGPTPAAGGTLFTIGSAPSANPSTSGTRRIRALPNRRGGAKR